MLIRRLVLSQRDKIGDRWVTLHIQLSYRLTRSRCLGLQRLKMIVSQFVQRDEDTIYID